MTRCLILVLLGLSAPLSRAQSPASAVPEFSVASIKPSDPGTQGGSIQPGAGRFAAANIPLLGLICFAYDIRDDQLSGIPGWAISQCYDVLAKSESPGSAIDTQRQMLQKLLADRFQLKVHHETRERPVYALVVDKSGPKMKENNDLKSAPFPGIKITGRGQATARIVSMSYMVQFLTSQLGRMVLDKTGLNLNPEVETSPDERSIAASIVCIVEIILRRSWVSGWQSRANARAAGATSAFRLKGAYDFTLQ